MSLTQFLEIKKIIFTNVIIDTNTKKIRKEIKLMAFNSQIKEVEFFFVSKKMCSIQQIFSMSLKYIT